MQDVSHELLLTIPSILPIPLSALMYYLKQNMSQFSHAPNYADNKPENRFQVQPNSKYLFVSAGVLDK